MNPQGGTLLFFGSLIERFDRVAGVKSKRVGPFHQFHSAQDFLPGFHVADVVLTAFEPFGEVDLP